METKSATRKLAPGDLVLYPYLWSWESGAGLRLADKVRPCLILFRGPEGTPQEDSVLICAITSAEVRHPNRAIDIPPEEGKRAKIRRPDDSRVVVTECNSDKIGDSIHLNGNYLLENRFSSPFITELQNACRDFVAQKKMRMVVRVKSATEDRRENRQEERDGDYEPG